MDYHIMLTLPIFTGGLRPGGPNPDMETMPRYHRAPEKLVLWETERPLRNSGN